MKTAPENVFEIGPEDFHRLGVRPDEMRISVIRKAATLRSKSLAARQLRTADMQTEVQLSRVVTSAYRLLDPRRRGGNGDRRHVGRIHSSALLAVGAVKCGRKGKAIFGAELIHLATEKRAVEVNASPAFNDSSMVFEESEDFFESGRCAEFTKEEDLQFASASNLDRYILSLLASGLAIIIGIIWLVCQPENVGVVTRVSADSALAHAAEDYEPFVSVSRPLEFAMASHVDEITELDRRGLLEPGTPELAPIPSTRRVLERFASSRRQNEEDEFQRPSSADMLEARRKLQVRMPSFGKLVMPNQVNEQIHLLQKARRQVRPGSADDWTCQMMVVELTWLEKDHSAVREQLNQMAGSYHLSVDELMAETFETACGFAFLPETQRHLLDQGFALADHLLIGEALSASRLVVNALRPLAHSLEQRDALRDLEYFIDAIGQAERLSFVAARIQVDGSELPEREELSDVLGSQAGILGRYYCLCLRRWNIGLPWLLRAADSRLASAARRQLAIETSTNSDDIAEVAELWLALADRADGRGSDSMRLHALQMLENLLGRSTGEQKVVLRQRIREQASKLPSYLQSLLKAG